MIRFEPATPAGEALPAPALDVEARFDEPAVWASLSPEQQAQIGTAALALAAAWAAQDEAELGEGRVLQTPLGRAAAQADGLAIDALVRLFDAAVPREMALTSGGQPRLPSILGPVCRRCGFSEYDACGPGCAWAAPDLCTACVDVGEHRG